MLVLKSFGFVSDFLEVVASREQKMSRKTLIRLRALASANIEEMQNQLDAPTVARNQIGHDLLVRRSMSNRLPIRLRMISGDAL